MVVIYKKALYYLYDQLKFCLLVKACDSVLSLWKSFSIRSVFGTWTVFSLRKPLSTSLLYPSTISLAIQSMPRYWIIADYVYFIVFVDISNYIRWIINIVTVFDTSMLYVCICWMWCCGIYIIATILRWYFILY